MYCGNEPVCHYDGDGEDSKFGNGAAIGWFLYFLYQFAGQDQSNSALWMVRGAKFVAASLAGAALSWSVANGASWLNNAVRGIAKWADQTFANVVFDSAQIALIAGYTAFLCFMTDNLDKWAFDD